MDGPESFKINPDFFKASPRKPFDAGIAATDARIRNKKKPRRQGESPSGQAFRFLGETGLGVTAQGEKRASNNVLAGNKTLPPPGKFQPVAKKFLKKFQAPVIAR
ncbi:hypothetical protein ACS8Y6_11690 [Salinisphaera sp. RV14]|uniref:hypothetical protein n=1 Tax=unclassified Salinisphaera TaxID=2649847 RepID=UPI003F846A09